ncbi:hypothetical protein EMIHUDRAFT_221228 [Emiliania huxleyi CCMP1516]|uniref:Uncharacterized protein n=2 Tax=Emiliania huxleyi TaxID=2903 RepID=A0A0D3HZH7_EMIH1|nr:hypothetical protein EMIHUDRAFT_221228 [Emiliania huxleyi CCMP1516]EOD04412.1 hypothetical protein EMIHUDRAFT_221228 [Emiliania huxleyi CCMP1516]|eukprot:XP_005756841.1 hypothetical protein EMIHUDRAFT_221228 [Emiliania huxleyi CCMP1516]
MTESPRLTSDEAAKTLLDLPEDLLALVIANVGLGSIQVAACSLLATARFFSGAGQNALRSGSRLCCAAALGCSPAEVESVCGSSADSPCSFSWLRDTAFVAKTHSTARSIAATNHTLVAFGGQLLAFGGNEAGQVGTGHVSAFTSTICGPMQTFDATAFVARQQRLVDGVDTSLLAAVALPAAGDVSAGRTHSLALTLQGEVYAWGSNVHGQLGLPALRQLVGSSAIVVQVAAGHLHSVFLLRTGAVYCCGAGSAGERSGELGDGRLSDSATPRRALLDLPARAVAAGGFHTLALGEDRAAVYGWGSAACGQLGRWRPHEAFRPLPTLVAAVSSAEAFPCPARRGGLPKIAANGAVWSCGKGTAGALGHGGRADSAAPRAISALKGLRESTPRIRRR